MEQIEELTTLTENEMCNCNISNFNILWRKTVLEIFW